MKSYEKLSETIRTPAFVFDIKKLKNRVAVIRQAFGPRIKLCYAMKTNPHLLGELIGLVDFIEVCSPGEYRICERNKVPKDKLVLSGVYKETSDFRRIVGQCGDKATYTVESVSQLALLCQIARETDLTLPVILRLSCGNQFGADKDTLVGMIEKRKALPVAIKGIQYYSGTQKKTDKIQKEIAFLKAFAEEIFTDHSFRIERIEYGPGMRVNYFESDSTDEKTEYEAIGTALETLCDYETVIELGRSIAADCGEYYTQIVDTKLTDGVHYCIVDGGIHHLNYYGQNMAMKKPFIRHIPAENHTSREAEYWTICGSLCTAADLLVKSYSLQGAAIGDALVFENVGAYSVTEGIYLFLSRDMPRIYKRSESGELILVRDVIQTDKINSL